jgi:hypothetical protein
MAALDDGTYVHFDDYDAKCCEVERLVAQVERLRAVLTRLTDWENCDDREAREIAAAALAAGESKSVQKRLAVQRVDPWDDAAVALSVAKERP